MKSTHTQGPWFLDQYGHVYGWDVPQPHLGTSTSVHICTPATFADRALIAAAPELLAALKMALEAPDDDRSWEDDAIAAIARATGGSV